MSWDQLWPLVLDGLWDTLYMTIPSTILSYLIGMPLGLLLVVTAKSGIRPLPKLNAVLGVIINFLRSIPFIILLAMLFPVTRAVMGRAIGTQAVIFPLVISAFPYVARMVEGSILEVDRGVIEAAQSLGSTDLQLILKVLIPEALPSLLNGAAIVTVTILGYTAMASAAGGGGLGAIAITKGLNLRKLDVMYVAAIALVILVQIITISGNHITKKMDHRKR
ncbi:MAG: ABC transporter permease [Clostridiales bacterium]|jgi:D-methionine transport system permease protein|nr:ABC transporter permease [Clostridiales bacterium]